MSFEVLLERQPATSILRGLSLDVISQYFAGYPAQIRPSRQQRSGDHVNFQADSNAAP